MNRRAFTSSILYLGLGPLTALATQSHRVAIGVESDGSVGNVDLEFLSANLAGTLIRSGLYQVVDRARLAAALHEQGLSNSPYADPRTAAALGRIVGAQRLLHVTLSREVDEEPGPIVVTHRVSVTGAFQLVGVETATILASGTAEGNGERRTAPGVEVSALQLNHEALSNCASDIAQQVLPN